MTPKEQLHRLVDGLGDDQADRALVLLKTMTEPAARRRARVPRSLGVGASGRGDVSQRVDELLADWFGR